MSCATFSEAISATRLASSSGESWRISSFRAGSVMGGFTCTVETLRSYEVGHLVRDQVANWPSGRRAAPDQGRRDVDPRHLEEANAVPTTQTRQLGPDRVAVARAPVEDSELREFQHALRVVPAR